jgi:hypothetical protein
MSESIELTEARLREVADLEAIGARVAEVTRASLQDPLERVRFLARYTSWNAFFGAGVAALAGKVARSRGVFLDPAEPVRAVADRSVLVGSYFFDAARDEFDDGGTAHRDTHRCLAQALIRGVLDWEQAHGAPAARAQLADLDFVNRWLADPLWLVGLNHQVAVGYGGGAAEDVVGLFRPMGYHLGSERPSRRPSPRSSRTSARPRWRSPASGTRRTSGSAPTRGTARASRPSTSSGRSAGSAWPSASSTPRSDRPWSTRCCAASPTSSTTTTSSFAACARTEREGQGRGRGP